VVAVVVVAGAASFVVVVVPMALPVVADETAGFVVDVADGTAVVVVAVGASVAGSISVSVSVSTYVSSGASAYVSVSAVVFSPAVGVAGESPPPEHEASGISNANIKVSKKTFFMINTPYTLYEIIIQFYLPEFKIFFCIK